MRRGGWAKELNQTAAMTCGGRSSAADFCDAFMPPSSWRFPLADSRTAPLSSPNFQFSSHHVWRQEKVSKRTLAATRALSLLSLS